MRKSFTWIKLYTDILNNPILGRQPESVQLRYIQLQLIAGQCDADGALLVGDHPLNEAELAWRLRVPVDQLRGRPVKQFLGGRIDKGDHPVGVGQ